MLNERIEGTTKELPEKLLLPQISPIEQEDLTFLDALLMITSRKKLVALVTAVCTGIGLIFAFALPIEYTATVTILPPQGNALTSAMFASQPAETGSTVSGVDGSMLGMKNINDMLVSMMKSRSVEDAVIQRYGLQTEYHKTYLAQTRKALEKHTQIDGSTKDGLIRLNFTDRDPNRAAEIANGYVDQFRALAQSLAITEASQRKVIFQSQLDKTRIDLQNANEAMTRTQLSTGIVQIGGQTRAMIESAAHLRAQIVAKEVQIQAMRSYAGGENPALTQLQMELERLRSQFNKLVDSKGDVLLPKGAVPNAGLEYVRKLRDLKYYEAISEVLARQLELAKLDEAREGAYIQVVEPAVAPEQRSFPKRGLFIIAGLTVGFTLGIMLALMQGGLARMQKNPATREKLELLKRSLWSGGKKAKAAEEEVPSTLRHARPETS